MRTLYLPIHAPGSYHNRSVANKHGLRDALALMGDCRELDYLSVPDVDSAARNAMDEYKPDLLFLQMQGTEAIPAAMLAKWRIDYPSVQVANWNGDVYEEHLTSPEMLDLLRHVDVQLTVNASVLPHYALAGYHSIRAAYCPFGYETPLSPLPSMPSYDIVFLGNNYSDKRQELYTFLRRLPFNVGVYGVGWERSEGECNYDFATAEALYQNAKIAISDNQFPDARGYMSDRSIQVLAAGGAMLMQQDVLDLDVLTGLSAIKHYIRWTDYGDLEQRLHKWLRSDMDSRRVHTVSVGQEFVLEKHTWLARVQQLMREWLPEGVR